MEKKKYSFSSMPSSAMVPRSSGYRDCATSQGCSTNIYMYIYMHRWRNKHILSLPRPCRLLPLFWVPVVDGSVALYRVGFARLG